MPFLLFPFPYNLLRLLVQKYRANRSSLPHYPTICEMSVLVKYLVLFLRLSTYMADVATVYLRILNYIHVESAQASTPLLMHKGPVDVRRHDTACTLRVEMPHAGRDHGCRKRSH